MAHESCHRVASPLWRRWKHPTYLSLLFGCITRLLVSSRLPCVSWVRTDELKLNAAQLKLSQSLDWFSAQHSDCCRFFFFFGVVSFFLLTCEAKMRQPRTLFAGVCFEDYEMYLFICLYNAVLFISFNWFFFFVGKHKPCVDNKAWFRKKHVACHLATNLCFAHVTAAGTLCLEIFQSLWNWMALEHQGHEIWPVGF